MLTGELDINDVDKYKAKIAKIFITLVKFARVCLNKKTIILVDEYDTPFDRVYAHLPWQDHSFPSWYASLFQPIKGLRDL